MEIIIVGNVYIEIVRTIIDSYNKLPIIETQSGDDSAYIPINVIYESLKIYW